MYFTDKMENDKTHTSEEEEKEVVETQEENNNSEGDREDTE